MNPIASGKDSTLAGKATTLVGGAGGIALGTYAGAHLFFPALGTALTWWIATKIVGPDKRIFIPAVSFQTAHLFWMTLGVAMTGQVAALAMDLTVFAVGLLWLMTKPGRGPLYLLLLYQFLALWGNGVAIAGLELGTDVHKGALVHIVWRLSAVTVMVLALMDMRRTSDEQCRPVTP